MKPASLMRNCEQSSFYDDFKDDRISVFEMLATQSGIEKVEYPVNMSIKENISDRSAFDTVWSIKYPGDELYTFDKKISTGSKFSNVIRLFRTLF
jgi:hypothetical protein